MTDTVAAIKKGLTAAAWELDEGIVAAKKKAKGALEKGAGKLAALKEGAADLIEPILKGAAGAGGAPGEEPPAFLAGMLLDASGPCHFPVVKKDLEGKLALALRGTLLQHVRDCGATDAFLASLAGTTAAGVGAAWGKVLDGLGVAGDDREELVGGLVEDTAWVATTLAKGKVVGAVRARLAQACAVADKLVADGSCLAGFAATVAKAGPPATQQLVLEGAGLPPKKAEAVVAHLVEGGKKGFPVVLAELRKELAAARARLAKIDVKIGDVYGPLAPLLDFKPAVAGLLAEAGAAPGGGDFLSQSVGSAQKAAESKRHFDEAAKIMISIGAVAACSCALAPLGGAGAVKLLAAVAVEVVKTGGLHLPELAADYENVVDMTLLEGLGIVTEEDLLKAKIKAGIDAGVSLVTAVPVH